MKKNVGVTLRGYWTKFRKEVPGKVQISILLVSIAVGIALWGGWLKLDTDHFVIEAVVAVVLSIYAMFVGLEADDHHDRAELLGAMLVYMVFNFYVSYEVTNENVTLPLIGEMRHAVPNLLQLGQWFVAGGIAGLVFNLVVDRDTALQSLAWLWRNNPIVWLLRPTPRDLSPVVERWRKIKAKVKVNLPDRSVRNKPPTPAGRPKRSERPERSERKSSE